MAIFHFLSPYLQNKTLQTIFVLFDHLLSLRQIHKKFFAAVAAHTALFPCLNFRNIIWRNCTFKSYISGVELHTFTQQSATVLVVIHK